MPLPCFSKLAHHRLDHLFGLVQLEVARVDVGGEHPDIALSQVRHQLRRMLQGRKAEERRHLSAAGGQLHRTDAHLDFRLGLFDVLGVGVARQILMRPGMGADRHAGRNHLLGCAPSPCRRACHRPEWRRRPAPVSAAPKHSGLSSARLRRCFVRAGDRIDRETSGGSGRSLRPCGRRRNGGSRLRTSGHFFRRDDAKGCKGEHHQECRNTDDNAHGILLTPLTPRKGATPF